MLRLRAPACCIYQSNAVVERRIRYPSLFLWKLEVPSSIKQEHEHLLDQMHSFAVFPDSTGRVVVKLDSLMQHHFREEEDFVLPPLGHLSLLASGEIPEHNEEVIQLTEKKQPLALTRPDRL